MAKNVTSRDLQMKFSQILKDIEENNEEYLITRYGKVILRVLKASEIDTPPPSVAKEVSEALAEGPVKSVPVKKIKLTPTTVSSIKVCPHQIVWGLGQCGLCGSNEKKYKY